MMVQWIVATAGTLAVAMLLDAGLYKLVDPRGCAVPWASWHHTWPLGNGKPIGAPVGAVTAWCGSPPRRKSRPRSCF
jgi:hypothetical protein